MTRTTNPTTSSKWIRPPPTCKLKPRSHRIRSTIKMVQSPECIHPDEKKSKFGERTERLGCMERQISNPQFIVSCTTCARFASPRVVLSSCKTNSPSAVRAEAAGSSPVVPATSIQCLTDLRSHQLFSLEDGSKPKNELLPLSLVVPEDAPPIAQVAVSVLQAKHAQMDARAPTAPQEKVCRRRRRNDASAAAPACLLRS